MLGGEIPRDLLIQILECLSVKSLARLKTVSTDWYALIRSDSFTNSHLLKQHRSCRVLLLKRHLPEPTNDDVLSFYDTHSLQLDKELRPSLSIPYIKDIKSKYNPMHYHEEVLLVGPCNGLICIFLDEFFMICNPTLRQFKKLPPSDFSCPKGYMLHNLAVGFGVSNNDGFKVIRNCCIDREHIGSLGTCETILLYNSHTNSWRPIDADASVKKNGFFPSPSSGIFLNGACHWNAENYALSCPYTVLTFNISTETFGLFEYSDAMQVTNEDHPYLMIYGEFLSIARYNYGLREIYIEIWVMKEYGFKESWTKQFVVGPDTMVCSFVCFKNGECLLVECESGRLGYYDLHTNDIDKLCLCGDEGTFQGLVYEETLISVNNVINSGLQIYR